MSLNQSLPPNPKKRPESIFPSTEVLRTKIDALFPDVAPTPREALLDIMEHLVKQGRALEARLFWFTRQKFGRTTEGIPAEQLNWFMETPPSTSETPVTDKADSATPESDVPPAETPEQKAARERDESLQRELKEAQEKKHREDLNGRRKPGRCGGLPPGMERQDHPAEPPCACEKCLTTPPIIATETSERLEYRPACLIVHTHARHVIGPCKCPDATLTRQELVDKPISKGLCDYSLLAHVVIARYVDHIPFHHMSGMFERLGHRIPSNTLGHWSDEADEMLAPLVPECRDSLLKMEHVGLDDTRMLVLAPDHPGHRKKGHIWCYVGYENLVPQWVYYEYTPDWKGEHPREVLKGRVNSVQGDGYSGVDPAFNEELLYGLAGCMSHARRKFEYAFKAGELETVPILKLMQRLYEVEELARLRGSTCEGRLALRQMYSIGFMAEIRAYLEKRLKATGVGVLEAKALKYLNNQWSKLTLYLTDGKIPIDNNEVERQIRPVARGRRLHLFAGSDDGARRMANLYTLMGNCRLAGVNPYDYVLDVLRKLKHGWPKERLQELLPQYWLAAQKSSSLQPPLLLAA